MSNLHQDKIKPIEDSFIKKPSEHEVPVTVAYVKEQIEQAKSEIRDQTKADIKNEAKEIEKQVLLERASLITVFGLFASITSFLVIEFQCLKELTSVWGILGFSCVIFALLLGFNIGLDYLIKSRFDKEIPTLHCFYIVLIIALFGIGCFAVNYGEKRGCRDNRECSVQKVESVVQSVNAAKVL